MSGSMGGGIYYIANLDDGYGTAYVGSTYSFRKRWLQHRKDLRCGVHANPHLQAAYNKYGLGSFAFGVAEAVEDDALLLGREQHWLDAFRTSGRVYNLALVAGSPMKGRKHTTETRRKLSKIGKGRKMPPRSAEHCRRISEALTGRIIDAEWRRKMSVTRKGRPSGRKGIKHTPEARAKMSAALRGREQSPERARKISDALAQPHPAFVNERTGDTIPEGVGLNRMCKARSLDTSAMSKVVRGKLRAYKGWILQPGAAEHRDRIKVVT